MAIESVGKTDSLDQGRAKWNSNDAELKTITDTNKAFIDANTAQITIVTNALGTTNANVSNNDADIAVLNNKVFTRQLSTTGATASESSDDFRFSMSSVLTTGYILEPGTVTLSVNGVFYTSNTTQTDEQGIDFYIDTTNIYFKKVIAGGSLDLFTNDRVVIQFQQKPKPPA